MASVNVSISHEQDAVVAELIGAKLLADSRPNGRDQGLYLSVGEHLIETALLHIKDLPA